MKRWIGGSLRVIFTVLLIAPSVATAGDTDRGTRFKWYSTEPFVLDSTLAAFDVCYASIGNSGPNAGALITIDVTTGAGTLVGATGITGDLGDKGVPALAIKFTGEMYALDIGNSSNLYLIDAVTGAASLVGATGLSSPPAAAFDGNDVLYAIDDQGDLYRVDDTTGAATFVGATGAFIKGLAFDPIDAQLYGSDASSDIYKIDFRTGAATLMGNTGQNPSPDIHFNQAGTLFGSSGGGLSGNNLISIDKTTGTGTVIGPIGFPSVSGMAARLDRPSPATLRAYESRWAGDHVEVTWRLIDIEGALTFNVARAADDVPFQTMRDVVVDRRGGTFSFADHTAALGGTYYYRVVVFEDGTAVAWFETTITTPPARLSLEQNHPNPFNPMTTISFSIDRAGRVSLVIYDISGRQVRTLVDGRLAAGPHSEEWDGRDDDANAAATGVYFVRLMVGSKTLTRKAVLLK